MKVIFQASHVSLHATLHEPATIDCWENWPLLRMSPFVGCPTQNSFETIYIQATKMDSAGSIYVYAYIHMQLHAANIFMCNNNIQRKKKGCQLENGDMRRVQGKITGEGRRGKEEGELL